MLIVLHGRNMASQLSKRLRAVGIETFVLVDSLAKLSGTLDASTTPPTLVAFNTGVVVPIALLGRVNTAVNYHAAPPEYPGRDPHHWAIYGGAQEYGVTLHVMTERADEGPILAVERFPILLPLSPYNLCDLAENTMLGLFSRLNGLAAKGGAKIYHYIQG